MFVATHAMFATLPYQFIPANWTQVNQTTFGLNAVHGITYAAGKYVAVGSAGTLATATTPTTWTQRSPQFGVSNIYAIAYGDGKFIAGGSNAKMSTSPDGITWTPIASPFGTGTILTIAYSDSEGIWVAAGSDGKLATSEDGINWLLRLSSFSTSFIRSIHVRDGLLVAVGDLGKLATSTDGISWTQRISAFGFDSIYAITSRKILDNQNQTVLTFVSVGAYGKVSTSTNGTSWSEAYPSTSFGSSTIRAVAFGGSNIDSPFVAGGATGKIGTAIIPRTGDFSWVQRVSTFGSSAINGLISSGDIAVAVGNSGKIAYSGSL